MKDFVTGLASRARRLRSAPVVAFAIGLSTACATAPRPPPGAPQWSPPEAPRTSQAPTAPAGAPQWSPPEAPKTSQTPTAPVGAPQWSPPERQR